MKKMNCVVILALLGMSSVMSAALFVEDFDSYADGSALHGQGGWKGWSNDPAAGAPVSSTYANSGTNSVAVVGTSDLVHEFDIAGGLVEFSVMQYIARGGTGESYFILLNAYDDAGVTDDWSVQIRYNLETGVITSDNGGGATGSIVYDKWVELKFAIDLVNNTVNEYYNGSLISSHEWDDNFHGTLGAVDLFGNGASTVYYDDLTIVPEPMTLSLLSLGGLALLRKRQ